MFTGMSDSDLINSYSALVRELKSRNIIRSKNVTGDLGEFIAIKTYNETPGLPNLQAAPPGTQHIDALSRRGERYSIKATTSRTTGVFYGLPSPQKNTPVGKLFEYVIIVKFSDDYAVEKILELNWDKFLAHKRWHSRMRAWNISITEKLISEARNIQLLV